VLEWGAIPVSMEDICEKLIEGSTEIIKTLCSS
jgi:hypothetical protein